jgi:hypothetical protein
VVRASGERMTITDAQLAAHEERTKLCRSCLKPVIWFTTMRGKKMPVDAETVEANDEELDLSRMVSHFVSCPDRDKWRKPR